MSAAAEHEAAWVARLAPWAAALRECLRADAAADELGPSRSFPWLEVALPAASGDARQDARELARMRQALELLALLAFRCHGAWKALLRSPCEVDASDPELFAAAQVAPRFLLLLDGDSGDDVARGCALLLAAAAASTDTRAASDGVSDAASDAEFDRLRRELLAAPADRSTTFSVREDGELAAPRAAICLEFAPSFVGRDAAAQYLASVRAAVAGVRADARRPDAWFALDSVRLATNAMELSPAMGDVLADLVRMGVKLSALAFALDEGGAQARLETRAALGAVLSSLLAAAPPGRAAVERVSLLALRADVRQFAGLLSALAGTALAAGVDLILDEESAVARRAKWMWVAFAAFRAGAGVRKVEIYDQFLLRDDVAAMHRLLRSANPVPLLSGPHDELRHAADQGGAEFVHYLRVKPTARLSLEPLRNVIGWDSQVVEIQQAGLIRAVEFDDRVGHVEVLMPGYGLCWVNLDDIESVERHRVDDDAPRAPEAAAAAAVEAAATATATAAQHQVTSLTIGLLGHSVRDPLALRSLLGLVGGPLRRLSLYQKEPLARQEVQAILRACPRLERLKLHNVELDSMDVFMDAYERHRGRYASTLILENYRASGESLLRFAELLAAPTSAVATSLRELSLRGPMDADALDERCLRAFLAALAANDRLEYLELHVRPALRERFAMAFQRHDGETLRSVRAAVPRACRFAFLAAAYAAERRIGRPGLADERLVRSVLEFAASRASRTVLLRAAESPAPPL